MKIKVEKKLGSFLGKREITFEVSEIDTVEELDSIMERFNLHV